MPRTPRQSREEPITRRDALKDGLSFSATAFLAPALAEWLHRDASRAGDARPYLEAAQGAGRWIATATIADGSGARWPADPRDPGTVQLDLYNGTPGVVPFWLELHHATQDGATLAQAVAGADFLLDALAKEAVEEAGLYTGMAGIGWVLAMTASESKSERHADGAARALELVKARAKSDPSGSGIRWSDSTDIISGSAGIGLYLLWARQHFGDATALDLAVRAGLALLAAGERAGDGLRWRIDASMQRNYPNFSHGTAGVSYFLATLYQASGERLFLDASLAGARYLQSLATTTPAGGRMVFHSEPGNEQIFYLSWCHGPAGTARLFHRLATITGDPSHGSWVDRLALATVDMKVPQQSPGFWNNISQCCGNCGVTEFFLGMHRFRSDPRHLEFAELVARDTLSRSTADAGGLKWIQAENRVSPEQVVAQTGLMQGAAGVGLAMLHLDGALTGRQALIRLPDDPFV